MIDLLKQFWCALFGHRSPQSFWVRDDHGAVRLDYCPRCETVLSGDVEDVAGSVCRLRVK